MADSTIGLTVGVGENIAFSSLGGLSGKSQVVKIDLGADGATSPLVRGQQLAAASIPVVLASDTSVVPVSDNGGLLSVDDGGGSLTVDGAVTVTNATAANLNATVVGTGTFAVQATIAAGASAIAKAEDVLSADGDVGVPAMAVRKASPANSSGTDGDYEFLQVSGGRLWASSVITDGAGNVIGATTNALDVNIKSSATLTVNAHAVTVASGGIASGAIASGAVASGAYASGAFASGAFASGSIAVGAIAAGATSIAENEDVGSADGDRGVKVLAVRKGTPANSSGTDGDYEFLQVNAGRLWTSSDLTISGTIVDGNSGNKSAQTLRVVLATDQPALTNKLLVTPDSVALPANQSVNVSQFGGSNAVTGTGVSGAGIPRVTVSSDSSMVLAAGTAVIGQVLGSFVTVTQTLTKSTTTTTYTIGDAWADSISSVAAGGYTFSNCARISGGSGIITDIMITNSVSPALLLQGELWIYDSAVATNDLDNVAFTNSDADVLLVVAVIPFTLVASAVGALNSYAHIQNLSIGFTCVGTAHLRFKVKVQNAYVNTSQEVLQFRLKITQAN